jgi:YD repeat-containing protein
VSQSQLKHAPRVLFAALAFLAFTQTALAQGPPMALECGTAVDGSLAAQSLDFYTISAQAGDSIWLRVLATGPDNSFVPKVALVDFKNLPVTARPTPFPLTGNQIDPLVAGATFGGVFDLAQGGTYRIQVQNPVSSQGFYRIVFVWLNKPCSLNLSCGAAVTGQIASKLQLRNYSFAAKAGDLLSIRLGRTGSAVTGFDAAVFAFGPDGQLMHMVASPSATAPPPLAAADTISRNPTAFTVKPSTDGPVSFVVFDPANLTGSYTISVSKLNGPCGSAALTCASPTLSSIAIPLATDSYSLSLAAGDPVSLRTAAVDSNSSLVPFLTIYDPQGNLVDVGAAVASGTHAVVRYAFTAKVSGSYTILAQDGSRAQTNTGSYAISILRPNQPCTNAQGLACTPVDGSVSGILGTNLYTVNAKATDTFLVRLLRSDANVLFRPHIDIYDPNGNAFQSLDTSDLARTVFTAASAGLYTLVVSDGFDNTQSGAYTLSVLPGSGACATTTLSCGTLASGSFSRPLAASVYAYTPAPGESFTIRMIDNTGALQPTVEVYDPRGNPAGQGLSGNLAGVDVTQPAGGNYTVIVTDGSKHPTGGAFGIDLLRTVNACGLSAPPAQTATGVVGASKPYISYTIPANSGDALSVRSVSFTSGFSAQMDLYDPAGTRIDSATFGLSRKIAATGNYTVIVGAAAARTGGAYSFAWQLLNHPAGAQPLVCGGTSAASLTASAEFRYYSVSAAKGDVLRLIFNRLTDNFSPQIELFDPAGNRLAQTSDISQKAGIDGNYLVLVSPSTSNGETGSYAVAFQRPNHLCSVTTLTCGQTALRQVNAPGQIDAFSFTGTGGDQADLRLAQRSGTYSPALELYDSQGTLLISSSGAQVKSKLPASGTYGVLVRDRAGVNTGSYRVSLQDDTNACNVNDTEAPAIALASPTGGEVIMGGTPYNIQWLSDDNVGVATHDVALSTDGGQTFPTAIASGLSGNTQAYSWNVPPDIAPARKAVIRVTATDGAGNATPAASGPISLIGSGFSPNSSATDNYDALNRLLQAILGDGRTIQYTWDAAGNLVSITVTGQ